MRAVEGDVRDVRAAQSRLATEWKGLRVHTIDELRIGLGWVGRSVGHLDPTAMLFLPLACMVIDPAPLWPLFPAAKKITVFCAVRTTAHAHRLVRYCTISVHTVRTIFLYRYLSVSWLP